MTFLTVLTILFAVASAITIFDTRLNKAKKLGILPPDEPVPGQWINLIYWLHWLLAIAILVIDWKYAILVFIGYFVLSFLPVLEIAGNIIMRPFRPKK